MLTSTIATSILLVAGAMAAPTATEGGNQPDRVARAAAVTHTIASGRQLTFQADNVIANVGDVVEWHFAPANHSVVQSSFADPCKPLAGGFHSGFNFFVPAGQNQATNVFQITITNATEPLWYYCGQTGGNPGHCQQGMVGVINQQQFNPPLLPTYKANAAKTGVSVNPPDSPLGVAAGNVNGRVILNPNPNAGF